METVYEMLGDANRLRILSMLAKKDMCVCELASVLGITPPSVSRHIKKMKSVGWVTDRQDGYWTIYGFSKQIAPDVVSVVMQAVASVADDETVRSDIAKAAKVDRVSVCCGH